MFGDPEGESATKRGPFSSWRRAAQSGPCRDLEGPWRRALDVAYRDAGPPNRAVSRPWAARSRVGPPREFSTSYPRPADSQG